MRTKFTWRIRSRHPQLITAGHVRPASRAERGQALVIIAMAMIGLLAFIGLTVDAGILFIGVGHLRRAVDAAALAASSQFREGRNDAQLLAAAREVVNLNGVQPSDLELWRCVDRSAPKIQPNDPALCAQPGDPQRKLIKVIGKTQVRFAFLTIIGFHNTEIVASATSEAASVDVVLVIDTSNSMTFDAADGDPMRVPENCNLFVSPRDDPPPAGDGFPGDCHPFEEVKQAAVSFINGLYYPYDRLAVVTFDNVAQLQLPITNTLTLAQAATLVSKLRVSRERILTGDCPFFDAVNANQPPYGLDPSGCMNTSIGGGLQLGGGEFGRQPIRQESLWVVILLTDGAANASAPDPGNVSVTNEFCPPSTWSTNPPHDDPFCRDWDATTRHTVLNPTLWSAGHTTPYNPQSTYNVGSPYLNYDSDDFARDQADFVGCASKAGLAAQWCHDSLNYADVPPKGGQGALIFAIGLGKLVMTPPKGHPGPPVPAPAGDNLLRYVANVGTDGNPDPSVGPDPCVGVAVPPLSPGNDSYNCGNYFFSEFGAGLTSVFESIASRIFTRLTQ